MQNAPSKEVFYDNAKPLSITILWKSARNISLTHCRLATAQALVNILFKMYKNFKIN